MTGMDAEEKQVEACSTRETVIEGGDGGVQMSGRDGTQ
jgi:hypothetical protein